MPPRIVPISAAGNDARRHKGCVAPTTRTGQTSPSIPDCRVLWRSTMKDMADDKKTDSRGPNKAEPQTKAKPAPNAVPGSNKKK